jgi:glycine/D-amino acid oxidase-like deaminating enzyme
VGCALTGAGYAGLSLWHETAGDTWVARDPLPGDTDADVAIVGAGFTGLWTAHYLAEADPALRIVVLEAEVAGFGASGRNGGWCSALFPASLPTLATLLGSDRRAAQAQHQAMRETVDEVARVAQAEGIDADVAKGGTISLARTPAQLQRARDEVAAARTWGRDEDDLRLLDVAEADAVMRTTGTRGATYTPDCAALHPGRLVRGLAAAVERRGVRIHEQTRVTAIRPGRAVTERGTVRADVVVRATEGYTGSLAGQRRAVAPVHSLIIATEQLPSHIWDDIGLRHRETFTDHRHLIIYGQRTADDRLVFGGRGAPYHFASRTISEFEPRNRVFRHLHKTLVELLPVVADARVTHTWGGALGVPRDWCASVGLDRRSGLAWAGGYVGDGVSTTNLAGRTLADLVLGRETDLVRLPWVGHRSRPWEPEPLRWLGINVGLRAASAADVEERLTGRPSRIARLVEPLVSRPAS